MSYLLLETGDRIWLESLSGFILLDAKVPRLIRALISARGQGTEFAGRSGGATLDGRGPASPSEGKSPGAGISGRGTSTTVEPL